MPTEFTFQTVQIIRQRKNFYKQRIPECSCTWKETYDIFEMRQKSHAIYHHKEQTSSTRTKEEELIQPNQGTPFKLLLKSRHTILAFQ